MKTKKELLGARIRYFRGNRNYTQEKLADLVGIDPKHLSRIENGRNYPSLETLEKIIEHLDVTYNEIFNFETIATKEELIAKINNCLNTLSEDKLKTIYCIVNEI